MSYIPSQWFAYEDQGNQRFCQTDGLLILEDRKVLVLIEVKYSHCVEAYWQIENLYLPVLRVLTRKTNYEIATVEVVKWYDPSTAFPRKPTLVEDIGRVKAGVFNVHILNR